jgi:phospholipase/carboxylesterase
MRYTQFEATDSVVLTPSVPATAAVIWLHGLGADGHDFVPIVPELQLPESLAIRFIFPHARMRPVTINNGNVMRAWYDIKVLAPTGIRDTFSEDEMGIRESENTLRGYIERELDAGIAANRIVLAGFSQGGAIVLQTALRYPKRLAGVMALSTYLPLRGTLAAEASSANRDLPILICHGRQDSVVPMHLGEVSRDVITAAGFAVAWQEYSMAHEVCREQMVRIGQWLRARFA